MTWLAATPAVADDAKSVDAAPSYDALRAEATPLSRADLLGLGWSLTAACTDGDDLAQRQCRAVRDARAASVRSGVFVVEGDAAAVQIGEWSADTKSAPLVIRGCVACVEPAGGHYIVSSKAAPTWQGVVAYAATIDEVALPFKDEAAAKKWAAGRGRGLQTELVVRLASAAGGMWQADGKAGLAVDVLGFRVHDPCSGEVLRASGEAGKGPVDKAACRAAAAEAASASADDKIPAVPKVALPDQLDAKDIKTAMQPVVEAASACFDTYGVAGAAKLQYTISGDGSVSAYQLTGDFVDTPTGECIDQAARAVTFPKVKKKQFAFTYPLVLQ